MGKIVSIRPQFYRKLPSPSIKTIIREIFRTGFLSAVFYFNKSIFIFCDFYFSGFRQGPDNFIIVPGITLGIPGKNFAGKIEALAVSHIVAVARTTRIFPDTKFRSTKKLAINIGILAARYDIVLFAEINSRPLSGSWVKAMASYFTFAVIMRETPVFPFFEKDFSFRQTSTVQ